MDVFFQNKHEILQYLQMIEPLYFDGIKRKMNLSTMINIPLNFHVHL